MVSPGSQQEAAHIWLAPATPARVDLRVKASRFLADVARAVDVADAAAHLAGLQAEFPRATHHCWAYRVPDLSGQLLDQCSDAGEPSGTAGQPILRAMLAAGIEEASLVVVRWFGGTKLGVGPLGRAYREAAAAALLDAGTQRRQQFVQLEICFPFEASSAVRRTLHRASADIRKERAADRATLTVLVPATAAAELRNSVIDASRGKATVQSLGCTTGRCEE